MSSCNRNRETEQKRYQMGNGCGELGDLNNIKLDEWLSCLGASHRLVRTQKHLPIAVKLTFV